MSQNSKQNVLHIGYGTATPNRLHKSFKSSKWNAIRVDISADTRPDYVAAATDLRIIRTNSVHAVFCPHVLQHLQHHEIPIALAEILRVLKKDGFAIISVPDLQTICAIIADGGIEKHLYKSPAGPVTARDLLYGHHKPMKDGRLFLAHKTGFTSKTLGDALVKTGFAHVSVRRDTKSFSLWAQVRVSPRPSRNNVQTDETTQSQQPDRQFG